MKEIVRASIEDCSQIERFRLVTRLGNAILSNGGEVFRAEQAMEYAARALRLEAFNAYVIANGIPPRRWKESHFPDGSPNGDVYKRQVIVLRRQCADMTDTEHRVGKRAAVRADPDAVFILQNLKNPMR